MKPLIRFEASFSPKGEEWMDVTEEYRNANKKKSISDFDGFIKKSKYALGRIKYVAF